MKKNKFNYLKAQVTLKREKSVDVQVEILIERLKQVQESYFEEMYTILNQILRLRQNQIKNYKARSIAKERGINLTDGQIAYIFGYKYITPFTLDKIERGVFKVSTTLFLIKQDIRFQIPEYQNKVVDMFIKGKINTSEISRLSFESIITGQITKRDISLSNKQAVKIEEKLLDILKDIRIRKNQITDKQVLKAIKRTCLKILNELNEKDNK